MVQVDASTYEIIFSPTRRYWFQKSGATFTPYYNFLNVSLQEDTVAGTLTFTDNSNGTTTTVFNNLNASANPGRFVSQTTSRGVSTTVASQTGGQVNELQRSYTINGVTTVQSLLYTYVASGSASGRVLSVLYRIRTGTGAWTPVNQAVYQYYGASDAHGNVNDLKSVSRQLPDGSGGWNTVAIDYYRYWLAGSPTGYAHALKMHIGPEAYRLVFNAGLNFTTASDAALLSYVDHYFEYDPSTFAVTKKMSAVCPSCVGGGTTTDLYAYTNNPRLPSGSYNVWSAKTTQTLPDGSQIIVYTNYVTQPIMEVTIDSTGTKKWAKFYRYDTAGQLIWIASPSAVDLPASLSTIEAFDDLMHYDVGTGRYQYLKDTVGLIKVTAYDGHGNIVSQTVRQGQTGSNILLNTFTYTSHSDASGNTVNLPATSTSYPISGNTSNTITTSYAYTWHVGTNQVATKTTTMPVVSSGQNGSGLAATIVESYDTRGNLTQRADERDVIHTYTYDPITAKLTQQIINDDNGVTTPGVNVTSDFTYDELGRLTKTTGMSRTAVVAGAAVTARSVVWTNYLPSVQPASGTWDVDQVRTGNGYASGTGPNYTYTLVDPVTITKTDKDGRITDQITSKRSSGAGALSPTDTFNQPDWQSWKSTQYDAKHRTAYERVYFLIPTTGVGTTGTNYYQTDFGYDALERQHRVKTSNGTITRTVWTCPQWVASIWVGTDDTGATDANPAGTNPSNNMVMLTANVYDGGNAGGDGNLTEQTQYVSGTSNDTRVTHWDYDFRGRRISMAGEIDVYRFYTYDNFDRLTQTDQYDTSSSGNLIGRSVTRYDDRGRVYQQLNYGVDPVSGLVGNAMTTNNWYDNSGNVVQQVNAGDGQVFTKNTYNGAGWRVATYRGYNTAGTSYYQTSGVTNDHIFDQYESTYDEAGNVISVANLSRLNDAPATGTGSTGPLSYTNNPKARVSYSATWHDGVNRPVASANYGATASFSRPDTPPAASDTILVSLISYDDAGRAHQTIDPKGVTTQTLYDHTGRTTQKTEAIGSGYDRITKLSYTPDSQVAKLIAVNSATDNQVTTYVYGTALTNSGVARNDLLRHVDYPGSTEPAWFNLSADGWNALSAPGWSQLRIDAKSDRVSYTYNRQGQQTSLTDQRGTVRTFVHDKLGRLTNDCVTTVGSNTDSTVRRISTAYEVRGLVLSTTCYDSAVVGSGTILNQTKSTYNSFRQLTKEEQAHGGAVTTGTPAVQYAYASGNSGSNHVRQTSMTYPNGRVITYDYGTTGGVDDRLNRVTSIKDGATALATYTYVGSL